MKVINQYRFALAIVIASCCVSGIFAALEMPEPDKDRDCLYNGCLVDVIQNKDMSKEKIILQVSQLLRLKADVNGARPADGMTPLMAAAKEACSPLMSLFLGHDVDVDCQDVNGLTVLGHAQQGLAASEAGSEQAAEYQGIIDMLISWKDPFFEPMRVFLKGLMQQVK